jgi:ABC-type transporter Mla maintaining outer membrane lipid asymmetry permease subunit MlaE
MGARSLRWLRTLAREVQISMVRAVRNVRKIWWTNPHDLLIFARRLGSALFAVGWWPRFLTLVTLLRQFLRTFFRGLPVVVGMAVAIGLGLGVLADRFGVLLLPLVEQTFVLATVRDAMPLILALLLTARSGASVATRLGDDRQTHFKTGRADAKELLSTTLPHLVAGAATGWCFYRIAGALVLSGYHSRGSVSELVDGFLPSIALPLDPELALDRAVSEGSTKTALFGFIVAYVASGLGIATNEFPHRSALQRAVALQDAVWESGVTSIILCLLAAIVWWNVRGTVN